MKAVVLREVGGDLALEDVAEPEGDAVVDVRAAGINFADVLIRRGKYPQMPELPYVLGNEVAGDLDGRRILALPRAAGGYAQRVEVDPEWTFPLPDNASYAAGASFLTTYLTAYIPLMHVARPESVLVHAGDRKSTRLNSSHVSISYAVFCLKKKTTKHTPLSRLH